MGCGATKSFEHPKVEPKAEPVQLAAGGESEAVELSRNKRQGDVPRSALPETPDKELVEQGDLGLRNGRLRILQLDDFDLLDLLDETPMSAVFRLRHRRTGLTLAGKRIRKGCEVHRSGDYLNEVKMLQLCKSPYVVTLHGVCDSGPDFWTVLELCSGGRLESWLRRCPNTARTVILQLLEAVKYLHSKLVCHLDLKPDNVLLSGAGDVRLCDFITAVQLVDVKQQMMGKCGTPQFRAPEVETGGAYNGLKADIYSLGRTVQVAMQELPSASRPWPELGEVIPYMLQVEPSRRPGVLEVNHFLQGGSSSVLEIQWSSLDSVRCDEVQKLPPERSQRSLRNQRKGFLPADSRNPQKHTATSKVCGSNYCQRLGACICHDRVPISATIMSPQDRRAQLRRCNTP